MYNKCVVHPAHVPLVRKAEPAIRDRPADARPRRGFLGDRDRAGTALGNDGVEVAQKSDGLEVFTAAMDVWYPFARFAAVIAIEH